MRSSDRGAEEQSGAHTQQWVLPKWLEWAFTALGLIYVFFISIPGIFNGVSIAMEHGRATEAQQHLNTVFTASNLFISLCVVAYLAGTVLFNRRTLHPWHKVPLFILAAAFFVGCAYDSLAHLLPNKSLPLLVDVATRLAPGPMAILGNMTPIIVAAYFIVAIVIMVRKSRTQGDRSLTP
jgi:hypothetical protein